MSRLIYSTFNFFKLFCHNNLPVKDLLRQEVWIFSYSWYILNYIPKGYGNLYSHLCSAIIEFLHYFIIFAYLDFLLIWMILKSTKLTFIIFAENNISRFLTQFWWCVAFSFHNHHLSQHSSLNDIFLIHWFVRLHLSYIVLTF